MKEKKNSLKSNLFYNILYQISAIIMPLITAPYVARVIGAENLGIYSYGHSIALYFTYFAMLGISNYGNRYIAKVSDNEEKINKYFSSLYLFQVFNSLLALIIYLIWIFCFNISNKYLYLILILQVISPLFDVSWLFFGLQEFKITSIRQMIIKFLSFIFILILVKNKNDLWIYALVMSLSYFLSSFSLWVISLKKVKYKLKYNKGDYFLHLKPCLILFIPILSVSLYRVMDKIMIGKLSNMAEVGYYESAEKMIFVCLSILGAFATVMLPKMTNLYANNKKDEAVSLLNMSMDIALCIGLAIAFGIASVSSEFIPLFFGKSFSKSIPLSIALCVTIPFISWSTILRNLFLIPNEKDEIYVKSTIICAILNIVFNLIFIPKYNALGAVYGTWIAEIGLAIYQTYKVKSEVCLKKFITSFFIYTLFGILMFALVFFIKSNLEVNIILKLLLEVVIGGLFYVTLCFVYFIKTNNKIVMDLLKRVRCVKKGEKV